jgi:hypothetical protein
MDAEAHLDAPLAQPLREVGDRVLRLRDGHAVARGDDDRPGIAELGDGRGIRLAVLALLGVGAGGLDAEAAGDDREERPVHRLAHDVRQVRTRRADEGAGDDEQVVVQQEARRRPRPSRSSC